MNRIIYVMKKKNSIIKDTKSELNNNNIKEDV